MKKKLPAGSQRRLLRKIWRDAWQPPDRRPIHLWAQEHVKAIPYSPNPGGFLIENSPHLLAIFEAISDPKVRVIVINAAVQASKTLGVEIALMYIICNMPGPALWLDQTDEDAKDQSETRLQVLMKKTKPVRRLMAATGKNRHKIKFQLMTFANGMNLWVLGAHNKTNLQRRSIRWLIGDETWRWPAGHMAEAEARVTAFGWLGKCIFMSQGGFDGDDTDEKWKTTDMRELTFACPHCGHRQEYKWKNVEWTKDYRDEKEQMDFRKIRRSTVLKCENEKCPNPLLPDSKVMRQRLMPTWRFVVTNPSASGENVGFHWNALATMSWGELAELYLRAKAIARRGDLTKLREFHQKRLGRAWKENAEDFKVVIKGGGYLMGETALGWPKEGWIDPETGSIMPGPAPATADGTTAIAPIPLRVITGDVQLDHFVLSVRSWSADGSSRMVWREVVNTWDAIESLRQRFGVYSGLVFLDANWNHWEVYQQCAKHGWTALIGDKRATFIHRQDGRNIVRFYSEAQRIGVGCNMHRFSNLNVKDCLARLRRNEAGGPTWEIADDAPEEYKSSLESEHRKQQDNGTWLWEQIGSRPNHDWDTEVMQVCVALMLKIIGEESVIEATEADLAEEAKAQSQPGMGGAVFDTAA